ncbi:MAG: glutamine-hydrolyzing GMP synthase [Firmicutes bacterium]|nr:glutamine-hydrolyzing GMP synthase [Bacillota bacterium]
MAVIVLDFGAQYNHLIARRIREAQVFCEVLPFDTPAAVLRQKSPQAIVLSGGPASVFGEGVPLPDVAIFSLGIPILGICYGMQVMARMLGGQVSPARKPEYGRRTLYKTGESVLFENFPDETPVWMSHGDQVQAVPPGFSILAETDTTPIAAMADSERKIWAVQFHPEVSHTPLGSHILATFLFAIAKIEPDWKPADVVQEAVAMIQRAVPKGRALVALSGGVDSAVAAKLAEVALGERVQAVLIDHGLLRQGEVEEVEAAFPDLDLVVVDARREFIDALQGVSEPEQKRKIIGRAFVDSFDRVRERLGLADVLIQGTVYPDVIESGGRGAQTIKSHHNVGGLPEHMRMRVVEPLRWLFKDEVRKVGSQLGLSDNLVWRQPFPGPGLAVRIVGEITAERVALVRAADRIVREEVALVDPDHRIWQAFAVLLGIQSVGVMGDQRTYAHPIVVRVVNSEDGMTADWARIPNDTLDRISQRVVAEVPGINRVVYDITSKPPGTIEWE